MVRSLKKRSDLARDEALKLWYAYNSVLYKEHKNKPFPVLDFDDSEMVLEDKIVHVAGQMGLTGRSEEENFYSPELRSSGEDDHPSLPWKVRRLYRRLKRIMR